MTATIRPKPIKAPGGKIANKVPWYWSNIVISRLAPKSPNNKLDWLNSVPAPINSRIAPSKISTNEKPIPIISPSSADLPQVFLLANASALPKMAQLVTIRGTKIPKIKYKGKTLVFAADLIPTAGHIPIPYLMGYDVRPLVTMEEKKHFLDLAVKEDYLLFLEHDAHNQVVSLKNTEKGVRLNNSFNFNEI